MYQAPITSLILGTSLRAWHPYCFHFTLKSLLPAEERAKKAVSSRNEIRGQLYLILESHETLFDLAGHLQ